MKWEDRWENTWHKWFAWYPIKINGQFIWFDYVWRTAHLASYDGDGGWIWHYLPGDTDIVPLRVRGKLEGKEDYYYGHPNWLFEPEL